MKKTKLLFFLLLTWLMADAQECEYAKNGQTIKANDMSIRINTDGTLFHHNGQGHFINPDLGPGSPGTIRKAGLWIGGFEAGTNNQVLKMAASTVESDNGQSDFFPGPLKPDHGIVYSEELCNEMNQVWKVTREDIVRHLEDYHDNGVIDHPIPSVILWPGNGNPYFPWQGGTGLPDTRAGWAPFHDRNHDGIYDPRAGDVPGVGNTWRAPKEIYWTVFNDEGGGAFHEVSGGDALRVEVQLTGWVMDCPDAPWVEDYFFTEYKIINQALTGLDSLVAGIWVDFDLGCSEDDYIGCSPKHNTFYAYNADEMDGDEVGTCENGEVSYQDYSPVTTVTFLSSQHDFMGLMYFDKNGVFEPEQGSPETPLGFYNLLNRKWKYGTPLSFGGDGYDPGGALPSTDFAFPDRPSTANGWSMASEDFPKDEVYVLGSMMPTADFSFKRGLERGQIMRFRVAYGFHPSNYRKPHEIVDWALDYGVESAQAAITPLFAFSHSNYCNCPATIEEYFENVQEDPAAEPTFRLYPNPTHGKVTLKFSGEDVYLLAVYNTNRELVIFDTEIEADGRIDYDLSHLREGVYHLRLVVDGNTFEERLVIF